MFQHFLESLSDYSHKDQVFGKQLVRHLEFGKQNNLPFYAVHGFCTDGGVAASMLRYAYPEAHIVPLDYTTLKNEYIRPLLQDIEWEGIVDLEPFNNKIASWYVDHHQSVVGLPIKAKKIRFDADGDSGSFQLLKSGFIPELSKELVEIAVMTRITDTAGYTTDAPTEILSRLSDLKITETEGEEGRKQYEQRVWLLDDAWSTVNELHDQLNLHKYLAADGFFGIEKVLPQINEKRKFRKINYDIANNIDISSDTIIFVYPDEKYDRFAIDRKLQRRGVAFTVSLARVAAGVKISMRRSKFREKELDKIHLNELAMYLNGGGHPGASGGFSSSESEAIETIKNWMSKRGYSVQIVELD